MATSLSSIWRCRSGILLYTMLSLGSLKSVLGVEWPFCIVYLSWALKTLISAWNFCGSSEAPSEKVPFSWTSTEQISGLPSEEIENLWPSTHWCFHHPKINSESWDTGHLHFWVTKLKNGFVSYLVPAYLSRRTLPWEISSIFCSVI